MRPGAVALAIPALVVGAVPASSATIVQSVSSFNSFDPSLGTLNSVEIGYVYDVTVSGGADHPIVLAPPPGCCSQWSVQAQGGSVAFSAGAVGHLGNVSYTSTSLSGTNQPLPGLFEFILSGQGTTFADPSLFIGNHFSGAFISLMPSGITFSGEADADAHYTFGGPLNGPDAGFDRLGAGSITYHFTPAAAVPEPSTWAMMILGFALIGGALRSARIGAALSFGEDVAARNHPYF